MHYDCAKPQSCIVENFCTMGGQSLLSLPGTVEKKLFFELLETADLECFLEKGPQSFRG
jgi:hypothetical protein